MRIAVFEDLKIFDVGNKANVDLICNQINIIDSNVEIDLSCCIIDYPATSAIIDKILNALTLIEGEKTLSIVTNLDILELLLLHWLFIGSKFFSLDKKIPQINNIDDFISTISNKIKPLEIKLNIKIVNKKAETVKQFFYGN